MTIQKQFIDETAKPAAQIDIELCALLFAAQIRPELKVDDWTRVLDDQVNAFLAEYEVADGDPLANSELLIEVVGNALGYLVWLVGNALGYLMNDALGYLDALLCVWFSCCLAPLSNEKAPAYWLGLGMKCRLFA